MNLAQLVEQAHIDGASILGGAANVEVTHIAENSRQARARHAVRGRARKCARRSQVHTGRARSGSGGRGGCADERPEGCPIGAISCMCPMTGRRWPSYLLRSSATLRASCRS